MNKTIKKRKQAKAEQIEPYAKITRAANAGRLPELESWLALTRRHLENWEAASLRAMVKDPGSFKRLTLDVAREAETRDEAVISEWLRAIEKVIGELFELSPEARVAARLYDERLRREALSEPPADDERWGQAIDEAERWIRERSRTYKLRSMFAPVIERIREVQRGADAEAQHG